MSVENYELLDNWRSVGDMVINLDTIQTLRIYNKMAPPDGTLTPKPIEGVFHVVARCVDGREWTLYTEDRDHCERFITSMVGH